VDAMASPTGTDVLRLLQERILRMWVSADKKNEINTQ
jgi:hypothetical protein